MKLNFQRINEAARLPEYAHPTDSGMDVFAFLSKSVVIRPCESMRIPLGIRAEIPHGYELQVRPRSSMSSNGLEVAFGTVDEGYRGEISVTVHNLTAHPAIIKNGLKVAQMVLAPVTRAVIVGVAEIGTDTDRGANGFGSTGTGVSK